MNIAHSFIPTPSNFHIEPDYPVSKEELLDGLHRLNIGKWRRSYDNRDILDGTQWEINIFFSDGHRPVRIWGSNAYPDNFNNFLALLGVKADEMF